MPLHLYMWMDLTFLSRPTPRGGVAFASASYDAPLSITITGGSGSGFLLPLSFGGFFVPATFVGLGSVPRSAPCYDVNGCAAFTFGQANLYTLDLQCASSGPPRIL